MAHALTSPLGPLGIPGGSGPLGIPGGSGPLGIPGGSGPGGLGPELEYSGSLSSSSGAMAAGGHSASASAQDDQLLLLRGSIGRQQSSSILSISGASVSGSESGRGPATVHAASISAPTVLEDGTSVVIQVPSGDVLHLLTIDVDCEITRVDAKLQLRMPPSSKVVKCCGEAVHSRADLRQQLSGKNPQDPVEVQIEAPKFAAVPRQQSKTHIGSEMSGSTDDHDDGPLMSTQDSADSDDVLTSGTYATSIHASASHKASMSSLHVVPPEEGILDAMARQVAGRPILIVCENRHCPDVILDRMSKDHGSSVTRFDAALSLYKRPSQLEALGQMQRCINRGDWLVFMHATKSMSLLNLLLQALAPYELGVPTESPQSPILAGMQGSDLPAGMRSPAASCGEPSTTTTAAAATSVANKKKSFPEKSRIFIMCEPHPHFPESLVQHAVLMRFFAKDSAFDPVGTGQCLLRFSSVDDDPVSRLAYTHTGREESASTDYHFGDEKNRSADDSAKKPLKAKKKLDFKHNVKIIEYEKLPDYVEPAAVADGATIGTDGTVIAPKKERAARRVEAGDDIIGIDDMPKTRKPVEETTQADASEGAAESASSVKLLRCETALASGEKFTCLAPAGAGRFAAGTNEGFTYFFDAELRPLMSYRAHSCVIWDLDFSSTSRRTPGHDQYVSASEDHSCVEWKYQRHTGRGAGFHNRVLSRSSSDVMCVRYLGPSTVVSGGMSGVLNFHSLDVDERDADEVALINGDDANKKKRSGNWWGPLCIPPKTQTFTTAKPNRLGVSQRVHPSAGAGTRGVIQSQLPTISTVRCLATEPNMMHPTLVASGGGSGAITIFDAITQKQTFLKSMHLDMVSSIVWGSSNSGSPSGSGATGENGASSVLRNVIVSGSSDCTIAMMDQRTGDLVARYKTPTETPCTALALHKNDVVVCSGETLAIFDIRKQQASGTTGNAGGLNSGSPQSPLAGSPRAGPPRGSAGFGFATNQPLPYVDPEVPSMDLLVQESQTDKPSKVPLGTLVTVNGVDLDYQYVLDQQRFAYRFQSQRSDEALLHRKARAWRGKAQGVVVMDPSEAARCSVGMEVGSVGSSETIVVTASTDGCVRFHGYI